MCMTTACRPPISEPLSFTPWAFRRKPVTAPTDSPFVLVTASPLPLCLPEHSHAFRWKLLLVAPVVAAGLAAVAGRFLRLVWKAEGSTYGGLRRTEARTRSCVTAPGVAHRRGNTAQPVLV